MKHTPGPIKLYHHKTSGGAQYLSDKFVICPNGQKEGVFEDAEYIVRLDGSPELSIRNGRLKETAPDLLEACQDAYQILSDIPVSECRRIAQKLKNAITKATE